MRAAALGLEAQSRRYLTEIAETSRQPERESDPVSDPRRTVMVFMPDAPAENEKEARGDDERDGVAARVGVVMSNPEFISDLGGDLRAKFQFTRGGRQTYRRDHRANGHDLTAAANALYGRSDAALISEANPLLDERFRVIHTTPSVPMPSSPSPPCPNATASR